MSGVYDMFAVDVEMEKNGIVVNYDDTRVVLARAGGSNQRFKAAFKAKVKPYRYQMDNDQMGDEAAQELLAEVYAETVIVRMDVVKRDKETGEPVTDSKGDKVWEKNRVPTSDGKTVPFTPDNVVRMLLDLPEMFADIQFMATKAAHYRCEELEVDEGN